ncbi:DUF4097 family beta strand repeat-containing protein [Legionella longbeachae]|uniref:DUF4097 family beta strand repeat-containing protein n=1 Tax=Legionella longbeachae TaxID=450 RepID=UPI001246FE03|nr:DUF4097 family beta strand repeat-containing protein [Legionella longbeachae]QEY51862.1 DUF4097 domain-containing protein [Legionella longbeachae]
MGITIEAVKDNEHFEYKGDVRVTKSIGKNATVIIKDGNLIVDGNVGTNSEIRLVAQENNSVVVSGSFFINNVSISGVNASKNLAVQGDIENGVTISSASSDLHVNGNIGNNCKLSTQSGDIKAGNVGADSILKTMSGDIKIGNVGVRCSLKTMSGDVKAGVVGSNSILKTMSGDVKVQRVDRSTTIETMSGDIYENGVKRNQANRQSNSVSISGMSFIGGNRIIINGRDMTDLINSSNNQSDEAPIRYTKGM